MSARMAPVTPSYWGRSADVSSTSAALKPVKHAARLDDEYADAEERELTAERL